MEASKTTLAPSSNPLYSLGLTFRGEGGVPPSLSNDINDLYIIMFACFAV